MKPVEVINRLTPCSIGETLHKTVPEFSGERDPDRLTALPAPWLQDAARIRTPSDHAT